MKTIQVLLTELSKSIYEENKAHGWWPADPNDRNKGECLALIHSEISEALEGIRRNKQDDHLPHRKAVEVELADAVLRILDFCGAYDLDIGAALVEKREYNSKRNDHRPEVRNAPGGKAF